MNGEDIFFNAYRNLYDKFQKICEIKVWQMDVRLNKKTYLMFGFSPASRCKSKKCIERS